MIGTAVFVDTEIRQIVGGAQIFLGRLLPGLAAEGWRTVLVTEGHPEPDFCGLLRATGVDVKSRLWPFPSLVLDAAQLLADAVNQIEGPCVYVVSVSSGIGWAAIPLLEARIPIIAITHSDSETFYGPMRHYRPLLTCAVAVSPTVGDALQKRAGLASEQIREIWYGVPVATENEIASRRPLTDGVLSCVYVGRLAEADKRVSRLIPIVKDSVGCRFTIIGDGPEASSLHSALRAESESGRVVFTGWLEGPRLKAQLHAADVILMTSDSEGLPIALLEGMGSGLVPVVADIPGCRHLVRSGVNGWCVPPGEATAYVARLDELRKSPTLLRSMSQAAWQMAREHSIERMAADYGELFKDAMELERRSGAIKRPQPWFPLLDTCRSPYPISLRRLKAALLRKFNENRHGRQGRDVLGSSR